MKRFVLFTGFAAACLCASAAVPARWISEMSRPAMADIPVFQGETVALEPTFTSYGSALRLTNCVPSFWYQTNGMAGLWWSLPATVVTSTPGRVRAVFAPTNDIGAARYNFFIRLDIPPDVIYRSLGTLIMRSSPGYTPNSIQLPVRTLDFSAVSWINAPWLSSSSWMSGSNALAGAIQAASASASLQLSSATGALAQATAASLAMLATNVTAQIAAIPAPSGVPIWRDGIDTNIFATLQSGTGYVWRVTSAPTNWTVSLSSNFATVGGGGNFTAPRAFPFSAPPWSGTLSGGTAQVNYAISPYSGWKGVYSNAYPITLYPVNPSTATGTASVAAGTYVVTGTNFVRYLSPTNDLSGLLTPAGLTSWWTSTGSLEAEDIATDIANAIVNNHANGAGLHVTQAKQDAWTATSVFVTNAPAWLVYSNRTGVVTLTNSLEQPIILQGTGAVSLAFSGLRSPRPIYAVMSGFRSVAFPSNTYFVGGGAWQTNRANHFVIWNYGSGLYVNPVTTTE